MTKLMSMRRFSRGGWIGLTAPVQLIVRDEIIGTFTPAGPGPEEQGKDRPAPKSSPRGNSSS